jgi:hypothetical protein
MMRAAVTAMSILKPLSLALLTAALTGAAWAQGTAAAPGPAAAAPAIGVELNKLESAGTSCRSYFLVTNRTPDALKDLRLEVYLFDRQGVVLRRIALPFSGLRSERSKVMIFDLADIACTDLDRLLVNEVLTCTGEDGAPVKGCADMVAVTTRASAAFSY